jgi:predicted aldo/keto reductase-like oxidoreductase
MQYRVNPKNGDKLSLLGFGYIWRNTYVNRPEGNQ